MVIQLPTLVMRVAGVRTIDIDARFLKYPVEKIGGRKRKRWMKRDERGGVAGDVVSTYPSFLSTPTQHPKMFMILIV